jgi:hypothetical protein
MCVVSVNRKYFETLFRLPSDDTALHRILLSIGQGDTYSILWHDAWKPEIYSQRNTAETSVSRQRLAETRFRRNEYCCPEIITRFMATENNRGINSPTWCSVFGPHEVSFIGDSDIQRGSSTDRKCYRLETSSKFRQQWETRYQGGVQCVNCCNQL